MLTLIYQGLSYGVVGAAALLGFIVACAAAWLVVEIADRILDYTSGGGKYGGTKRTRDDW